MTAEGTARAILDAYGSKDGKTCRCPVHEDDGQRHTPSLSVDVSGGKVLVHCHTGCEQGAVVEALKDRGLWPTRRRSWRCDGPKGSRKHGRTDAPDGKRVHWKEGDAKPADLLYLGDGWNREAPGPVVIVEGESDADALRSRGVSNVAGTVTGASKAPAPATLEWAGLPGRVVFLWPDRDPEGAAHMEAVGAALLAMKQPPAAVSVVDPARLEGLPDTKGAGAADWPGPVNGTPALRAIMNAAAPLAPASKGGKAKGDRKEPAGAAVTFEKVEPAETPRELGAILEDLVATLRRFMHLPGGAAETVACWVAWSYVSGYSYILPILALTSPVKGCGKSTLLDIIGRFVPRADTNVAPTPAALFRGIHAKRPTLLLDEADVWMRGRDEAAAAVRAVVNAGHKWGGTVERCVGDDHEVRRFRVDCPKAIAGIGDFMADATADRSIVITLEKAPPSAGLESFRGDRPVAPELRGQLLRWANDHGERFRDHDADAAPLRNREADNWRPLFGVADLAAGEWPARIRRASAAVIGRAEKRTDRLGPEERLLTDAFTVFDGHTTLAVAEFDSALRELPDTPYAEWSRGKPLSAKRRASMLRTFGIHVREGGGLRWYDREQFEETWAAHGIPAHTSAEADEADEADFDQPNRAGEKSASSASSALSGVPVDPPAGSEGEGIDMSDAELAAAWRECGRPMYSPHFGGMVTFDHDGGRPSVTVGDLTGTPLSRNPGLCAARDRARAFLEAVGAMGEGAA